jgi:hypothetical protein
MRGIAEMRMATWVFVIGAMGALPSLSLHQFVSHFFVHPNYPNPQLVMDPWKLLTGMCCQPPKLRHCQPET